MRTETGPVYPEVDAASEALALELLRRVKQLIQLATCLHFLPERG